MADQNFCETSRVEQPNRIQVSTLKKTRKAQQFVKQWLPRLLKLPKRKISLLQQRREPQGVVTICQYGSDGIHTTVSATSKEEAARQLRNLIFSAEPIGSGKPLKILTDDTRSPSALLEETLDRSG
jgi:hypothetical protein